MREIKFRTFDEGQPANRYPGSLEIKPKICEVYSIHFRAGTMRYKHPDLCYPDDGPIKNLMQYTGLKDKNGTDIYEGDIVKIFTDVYEVKIGLWCGLDYYDNETYGPYGENAEQETNLISKYSHAPEVIGNIYENRELLE